MINETGISKAQQHGDQLPLEVAIERDIAERDEKARQFEQVVRQRDEAIKERDELRTALIEARKSFDAISERAAGIAEGLQRLKRMI